MHRASGGLSGGKLLSDHDGKENLMAAVTAHIGQWGNLSHRFPHPAYASEPKR